MPQRAERDHADQDVTTCPECGHAEVRSVPFNVSGRAVNGEGARVLTRLAPSHFQDSNGFDYCRGCGLVLNDRAAFSDFAMENDGENFNHYARIMRDLAGFDCYKRRDLARLAIPQKERHAARRLAGVLYDAEALLSSLDIRGDAKADILDAITRFYQGDRAGGQPRYEAVIEQFVIQISHARCMNIARSKVLGAYATPTTQQRHAARLVREWLAVNHANPNGVKQK